MMPIMQTKEGMTEGKENCIIPLKAGGWVEVEGRGMESRGGRKWRQQLGVTGGLRQGGSYGKQGRESG